MISPAGQTSVAIRTVIQNEAQQCLDDPPEISAIKMYRESLPSWLASHGH